MRITRYTIVEVLFVIGIFIVAQHGYGNDWGKAWLLTICVIGLGWTNYFEGRNVGSRLQNGDE